MKLKYIWYRIRQFGFSAFMYLAEWVDAAGGTLNSIVDNADSSKENILAEVQSLKTSITEVLERVNEIEVTSNIPIGLLWDGCKECGIKNYEEWCIDCKYSSEFSGYSCKCKLLDKVIENTQVRCENFEPYE